MYMLQYLVLSANDVSFFLKTYLQSQYALTVSSSGDGYVKTEKQQLYR